MICFCGHYDDQHDEWDRCHGDDPDFCPCPGFDPDTTIDTTLEDTWEEYRT